MAIIAQVYAKRLKINGLQKFKKTSDASLLPKYSD